MTTKDRILDAAESLFSHDGLEATSLRAITAKAGVNLAAVNYHFQSKDALIHAVIARRIDPVNQKRLEMLDVCEATFGREGPLPLDQVLDAFLRPVLELLTGQAREFTPLMGRAFTESSDLMEKIFRKHFAHVAQRFIPAFQRALPDLPLVELIWRLHFVFGAVAHTMSAAKVLRFISDGLCDTSDTEATLKRMEAFLMAGLKAPVSVEAEHATR